MRLGQTVWSSQEGVRHALLARGVTLTQAMIDALPRAGVFAVYVEDGISEGIRATGPVSDRTRREAVGALGTVFTSAQGGGRTKVPDEQLAHLEGVVGKILQEVRASGALLSFLDDLGSFDAHTLTHSINVCILGLMLGEAVMREDGWRDYRGMRRRDEIDARLVKLGLGLLLHDVGKVVIPQSVLTKPGRLSDDEMELIRQHPEAGALLVEGGTVSALARAVIIGHHERVDGRGYPHGRSGEQIHLHARVAAVADVYDAVSSDRVYRMRRPSHEAYELVLGSAGTAFDPAVVRVFSRVVAPYPVGTAVVLSTGERGLVAENHPEHCTRPTVRITHDPAGGALAAPEEIRLVDHLSVTVVDSIEDPADPAGAPHPDPEAGHAEVLADLSIDDALVVGAGRVAATR